MPGSLDGDPDLTLHSGAGTRYATWNDLVAVTEKFAKLTQGAGAKPKFEPYTFPDIKRAASLIVDEVDRENVVHYSRQVDLNDQIHKAVKRKSGDRGWLIGRDPKRPDDDVTGVEAWAMAQLHYDTSKPRKRTRMSVAA